MGWCNIVFLVRLVLGCLGFKFRFCGLTMLVRWLGLDCCLGCWVGLMFGLLCLLVVFGVSVRGVGFVCGFWCFCTLCCFGAGWFVLGVSWVLLFCGVD